MRIVLLGLMVLGMTAVVNLPMARAEKTPPTATQPAEVTLTGSLACAVCELHENGARGHQDALVVKNGDREIVYFLTGAPKHANVCHTHIDGVTVKGVVTVKNGRQWVAVSSLELPKK